MREMPDPVRLRIIGLRRDLADAGMLDRESDGSGYWRVKEGDK